MENEEMLRKLKGDLYKEIDELKSNHQAFKKRTSVILNLIIPGIGFIVYGDSFLKGLITFVLFFLYNVFFFNTIINNVSSGLTIFYYTPAVFIWIASTALVSTLDD